MALDATAYFGLPFDGEKSYGLFVHMSEDDGPVPFAVYNPPDAAVILVLDARNGWRLGRHELPVSSVDGVRGRINFEVRYADLPDLVPVSRKVLDIPGSADSLVCTGVENRGTEPAGAFQVAVSLKALPTPLGTAQAGTLSPGALGELCTRVTQPRAALTSLVAGVDEPRGIFEQNEQNNRFDQGFAVIQSGVGNAVVVDAAIGRG
ncbi:MAG: CARDB domain-containing protein [Chloroflexota bacterium]